MRARVLFKSSLVGLGVGTIAGVATACAAMVGIARLDHVWIVFVMAGTVAALAYDTKQSLIENTNNRTRTLRTRLERLRRDVGDIHGMARLGPYLQRLPLPFGGGWALTGDSAALLAHEAITREPLLIVELGSGASTLILGQILANQGKGMLVSLDHDEGWAAKTRKDLEVLGLNHVVKVIHAPLVSTQAEGVSFEWYSLENDVANRLKDIDILFVDGPPRVVNDGVARNGHASRFPAFPIFKEKMSPNAVIFVDDAGRDDEKSMVNQWVLSEPEWQVQWFDTVDGVAILSRDLNN